MSKCPRQDPNSGTPEDIVEIECPGCGEMLEFFKDEASQKCLQCGQTVATPRSEPN